MNSCADTTERNLPTKKRDGRWKLRMASTKGRNPEIECPKWKSLVGGGGILPDKMPKRGGNE